MGFKKSDLAKQAKERKVVADLATISDLRIRSDTIESVNPPLPDVAYVRNDGSKAYVELVEAVDDLASVGGSARRLTIRDVSEFESKLRKAIATEFDRQIQCGMIKASDFVGCRIRVGFDEAVGTRKRLSAVPKVVDLLGKLGHGRHSVNDGVIKVIRCNQRSTRIGMPPDFGECVVAANTQLSVTARVAAKLAKVYEGGPVDLLVWSDQVLIGDREQWVSELRELLISKGKGPFERVIVYSRSEGKYRVF